MEPVKKPAAVTTPVGAPADPVLCPDNEYQAPAAALLVYSTTAKYGEELVALMFIHSPPENSEQSCQDDALLAFTAQVVPATRVALFIALADIADSIRSSIRRSKLEVPLQYMLSCCNRYVKLPEGLGNAIAA